MVKAADSRCLEQKLKYSFGKFSISNDNELGGIRTPDSVVRSHVLCPLSYKPKSLSYV